jgi:hypothetical protein
MRSAGRVSRVLVVLGFLSLLLPAGAASAGSSGRGQQAGQAKARAKGKNAYLAKKSKQKAALTKSKQQGGKKGAPKAAGFLPRPATQSAAAAAPMGEVKLAGTRTASAAMSKTSARARTSKARRPVARKMRTVKRTRRMNASKRRMARTQRARSRSTMQEFDSGAGELGAPEREFAATRPDREMGPMEMGGAERPSRFRRFMSGAGKVLKKTAKYAGYAAVVAAPMAVMAVGGLPIAFAIGAPAIFLGVPLAIGLVEQAAKNRAGGDFADPQQEMLERYMARQMLENQDLNGPGPGNGVAGVGGLNSLNNMIDPGGMR